MYRTQRHLDPNPRSSLPPLRHRQLLPLPLSSSSYPPLLLHLNVFPISVQQINYSLSGTTRGDLTRRSTLIFGNRTQLSNPTRARRFVSHWAFLAGAATHTNLTAVTKTCNTNGVFHSRELWRRTGATLGGGVKKGVIGERRNATRNGVENRRFLKFF